jgi:uncharacterized membrane protein
LCAPTFVLLAGISAFLYCYRYGNMTQVRRYLCTRGLLLIMLEFTIIGFGIFFDWQFHTFLFQVIAAIGFGLLSIGIFLAMPKKLFLILGILILVAQHLFPIPGNGALSWLVSNQVISLGAERILIIGYPPIQWMALCWIGFGMGFLFLLPIELLKKRCYQIGIGALSLFLLLRLINLWGDPHTWSAQASISKTFLSFLNVSKYPPSLAYVLLFGGAMFWILSLALGVKTKWTQWVQVFGKVPLFYYIIHWYVIHILLFITLLAQGFSPADFQMGMNLGRPEVVNGYNLPIVYLIWIAVVITLYPICKQYAYLKQRHTWLRYW